MSVLTTKEQELKALAQIRKIVDGLGENSYIATAFEGCFEIAEDNIGNDFGCSMKQRAEKAEKDASYFQSAANTFSDECEKVKEENHKLKEELEKANRQRIDKNLYIEIYNIVGEQKSKADEDIMIAARNIAKFKDNSETRQKAIDGMARLFEKKETLDKTMDRLDELEPDDL